MGNYTDDYVRDLEKQIELLQENLRKPEKMWCYWEEKPKDRHQYWYYIGNVAVAFIKVPTASMVAEENYITYYVATMVYAMNRISSIAEVKEIIEDKFWGTGVKKYTYV